VLDVQAAQLVLHGTQTFTPLYFPLGQLDKHMFPSRYRGSEHAVHLLAESTQVLQEVEHFSHLCVTELP
jgi:hypothetical protein